LKNNDFLDEQVESLILEENLEKFYNEIINIFSNIFEIQNDEELYKKLENL
jgi:hypothetical protein